MMRRTLHWVAGLVLAAALWPAPAWSALVGCYLVLPAFTGTYSDAVHLDAAGAVTITCTRDSNGKDDYYLRLTLAQSPAETLSNPYPDTLAYGIYTDALRTTRWTTQETAVTLTGNIRTGAADPSLNVYLRVPLGQVAKATGTYNGGLTATLQLLSGPGGTVVQTFPSATLSTQVTVPKSCTFGATLPSYALSYQAFRPTALTDSSQGIALTCTKGTSYTLTLDETTGVVPTVELRYGLLFTSTAAASVSALASSSTATRHGLTLTLPAGQAGSCSTGTCAGNSVRTVTVAY